MTTQSGKQYLPKELYTEMTDQKSQGGELTGMADMLRLLLEDCKRRDDELVGERQQREEQITEEQERYEREAGEQMRLMNQLMEALQRLVTESGKRKALVRETFGAEKPKLMKLTEKDDVEAYLTTFERMMAMFGVERTR